MPATRTVTIVGGGLAGLTLGIGLRQHSVPVVVWEAGRYPRHRVCGEFIRGKGLETLTVLGLRENLLAACAIPAASVAFFSGRVASPVRRLSTPALSISRYVLDDLLAGEFRRLGGELRENDRWDGAEAAEGVVRATGRRAQAAVSGARWFGLKVHARDVTLAADLEMHVSPSGYVGINRLAGGEVNVCGLFRRTASTNEPLCWQEALRGPAGSHCRERLAAAAFEESSFCAVAGLSLNSQRASASQECRVGDAITMIPPVTGNGMSMAFESAALAIEPLAEYSEGKIPWKKAQATIARRCDETFGCRLAWAGRLQQLIFMAKLQDKLALLAPRWQWLWGLIESRTR